MNGKPSVAVITVVYNAETLIERTMKSVLEQSWQGLTHIVVDGLSADKTLALVNQYRRPELEVYSERDHGIYDAMNKGLLAARTDYVMFLNAGDTFYANDVLQKIFAEVANADFYYGNTAVVNNNGEVLADRRHSPPEELDWKSFQFGMSVSHQSMVVRRALCEPYDLQYKISADIDWTIRILKKARHIVNTQIYISKFLEGGVSASGRKLGWKERFDIFNKHYGLVRNLINHSWIALRYLLHKATGRNMT